MAITGMMMIIIISILSLSFHCNGKIRENEAATLDMPCRYCWSVKTGCLLQLQPRHLSESTNCVWFCSGHCPITGGKKEGCSCPKDIGIIRGSVLPRDYYSTVVNCRRICNSRALSQKLQTVIIWSNTTKTKLSAVFTELSVIATPSLSSSEPASTSPWPPRNLWRCDSAVGRTDESFHRLSACLSFTGV